VLDKGRKDGIVPHSGVVTENGVVGIVRKVSEHYSVAMSILHRQTLINARLKNKGYFGPLRWESIDVHTFNLTDIPKDKNVAKGDTVETSGHSAIFPEGIMLGVVDQFSLEPGSNYFTIQVKASLDLCNLQYVYIVRNILKGEQDQLEQAVREEDE
jgi:rod shape-determining protein MreC